MAPEHPVSNSEWRLKYECAMAEKEPTRFTEMLKEAEGAMFARMQTLAASLDGHAEKRALQEAANHLYTIYVERLGFPDWKRWQGI